MFDPRSQSVNTPAMLALKLVFVLFVAFVDLFVQARKDEFEIIGTHCQSATIGMHNCHKLIKGSFGSDFIPFVLGIC